MARQRRPSAKDRPILGPGMIAWASDWPEWVRVPGQEEPHPIVCLGMRPSDGQRAILPCSKHGDQGKLQVPISREGASAIPSAFKPHGPLAVDPTWICVADKYWRTNLRWVAVQNNHLSFAKGTITLRRVTVIDSSQWDILSRLLAAALKQTQDRRR